MFAFGDGESGLSNSYIPSLDGIRAVSVIIVLISHAGFTLIPGGLGVTIFFFLSGFLITSLLLVEYKNSNTIRLSHFYLRRFFRLMPPLLVCLLLVYSLAYVSLVEGGYSLSGFLYQAFYLANYQYIFSWGGDVPKGLGILWSLAVEEHFYLLFPVFLLLSLKLIGRRFTFIVLAALCVLILIWRVLLVWEFQVEPIRTYYASDTRFDSILYGCLLALVWSPFSETDQINMSIKDWAALVLGLCMLLFTLVYRDPEFRETFRYSIQGLALVPLFYCAIRFHHHLLFRWLDFPVLKKLGVYSYCIYLIHFVVIGFLERFELLESIVIKVVVTSVVAVLFAAFVDAFVDPFFRTLRKRLH